MIKILLLLTITSLIFGCKSKTDKISEYYKDGNLKVTFDTVAGLFNGEMIFYYENEKIKSKQNWLNGVPINETTFFDSLGVQTNQIIYDSTGEMKNFDELINRIKTLYDEDMYRFYFKYIKVKLDGNLKMNKPSEIAILNMPIKRTCFLTNNIVFPPKGNKSKIKAIKPNEDYRIKINYANRNDSGLYKEFIFKILNQ